MDIIFKKRTKIGSYRDQEMKLMFLQNHFIFNSFECGIVDVSQTIFRCTVDFWFDASYNKIQNIFTDIESYSIGSANSTVSQLHVRHKCGDGE